MYFLYCIIYLTLNVYFNNSHLYASWEINITEVSSSIHIYYFNILFHQYVLIFYLQTKFTSTAKSFTFSLFSRNLGNCCRISCLFRPFGGFIYRMYPTVRTGWMLAKSGCCEMWRPCVQGNFSCQSLCHLLEIVLRVALVQRTFAGFAYSFL